MSSIRFYYDPLVEFGCLFDDALTTRLRPLTKVEVGHRDLFRPRMDIHESKDANIVTTTLELPGMKPDDITIDVHHDRLTVAGEVNAPCSSEEGGYTVRERGRGKFSRTLHLPFGTKPDNVKAKIEDGILTVTFPKTNPEQEAQRIAIQ